MQAPVRQLQTWELEGRGYRERSLFQPSLAVPRIERSYGGDCRYLQWFEAYIRRLSCPPYILPHRQLSFGTESYREISSKRTGQIQLLYGFGSWRWTVVSPFGNQETHRDTNRVDHLICSRQGHCGIGTTGSPPG